MPIVDLHSHSRASDGLLSPAEVARRAVDNGVDMLALTDHDELLGIADADRDRSIPAILGRDMPGNDEREDYLRSELTLTPEGWVAIPFDRQDSSMLGTLARAQALTIRPAHAAPARKGDPCHILPLR